MRRLAFILAVVLSGLLLATAVALRHVRTEPLPVLGRVTDFELIDTQGEPFSLERLQDRVWVADFIFTTCAGPCPEMTKQMANLHRSYKLEDDVRMVSVSVNPEYDSPAVLEAYAASYGADTEKWHFLTGAREEIHRLAVEGFKVGSVEDPVFHSTRFMLVDRNGRIRGYYGGPEEAEVQRLFKDIARVLAESRG